MKWGDVCKVFSRVPGPPRHVIKGSCYHLCPSALPSPTAQQTAWLPNVTPTWHLVHFRCPVLTAWLLLKDLDDIPTHHSDAPWTASACVTSTLDYTLACLTPVDRLRARSRTLHFCPSLSHLKIKWFLEAEATKFRWHDLPLTASLAVLLGSHYLV